MKKQKFKEQNVKTKVSKLFWLLIVCFSFVAFTVAFLSLFVGYKN